MEQLKKKYIVINILGAYIKKLFIVCLYLVNMTIYNNITIILYLYIVVVYNYIVIYE